MASAFAYTGLCLVGMHGFFFLCFTFCLKAGGNVALHSTIPFYLAFSWDVATKAERHV
jgi:hypothetical protein